ncbi:MAG: LysM peptidoglycan-binding domain-containing protein [Aquificae bacterium]|nr:LysM peptidoglycan-binding domain-containing protein [Aquificota bacterium]
MREITLLGLLAVAVYLYMKNKNNPNQLIPSKEAVAKTTKVQTRQISIQPVKTPSYYIVKKGDTLSKIARRFGTDWRTLARINKLKNPHLIRIGQKIRLR